jgi:hypothetical protein
MHQSSLDEMTAFRDKYLDRSKSLLILDWGSKKIGNAKTYRDLFDCEKWEYQGVDISEGENVDILRKDTYLSDAADVIISGQTLEHCEHPWEVMYDWRFFLKDGGLLCVIAPSSGPEHRYPVDCYRFLPDGMRALAEYVGMNVLDCYLNKGRPKYSDGSSKWKDCVLIARK